MGEILGSALLALKKFRGWPHIGLSRGSARQRETYMSRDSELMTLCKKTEMYHYRYFLHLASFRIRFFLGVRYLNLKILLECLK